MQQLCCETAEGQLILSQVLLANSFWSRLKGLLGRKHLAPEEGLLIQPCNSVHTLGMSFSIGVLFLDAEQRILHLIPSLPPGRLSPVVRGSRQVLELHPQTLHQAALHKGQQLCFRAC